MPAEDTIFVGDSEYFPYGPRALKDVRSRVLKICSYLVDRGCKLIVIACNTATAAGLKDAQREFGVPIIGVVEPGSRAAVYVTHSRKVGVIATQGTVNSGAYVDAIQNLDAGIEVIQLAMPQLVNIAEAGIQHGSDVSESFIAHTKETLSPMRDEGIDTLVMGCTHYPLIADLIQECIGEDVNLVSSAEETAKEVRSILMRQGNLRSRSASDDAFGKPDSDAPVPFASYGGDYIQSSGISECGKRSFLTTSDDTADFQKFAMRVIGKVLAGYNPVFSHVDIR